MDDNKIKKIKEVINNDYLKLLFISDQLNTCMIKYNYFKNHSIEVHKKKFYNVELNKELADLYILLNIYLSEELINLRIDKFIVHIADCKNQL